MKKVPAKERLRTGFTTGACAAAAARAAALGLLEGEVPPHVCCELPNGQRVEFSVAESHYSSARTRAVIIKDAGDDPDCTHGAHITVDVEPLVGDTDAFALHCILFPRRVRQHSSNCSTLTDLPQQIRTDTIPLVRLLKKISF